MKEWVEAHVQTGRYANDSDFVRENERREAALAELRAEIDEGFASGSSDMTLEDIRREAVADLGLEQDDAA